MNNKEMQPTKMNSALLSDVLNTRIQALQEQNSHFAEELVEGVKNHEK